MPTLNNSKRRLLQATYVQVAIKDRGRRFLPKRPWLKFGLLNAGKVTNQEVASIKRALHRFDENEESAQKQLDVIDRLERSGLLEDSILSDQALAEVSAMDSAALVSLAEKVIESRERTIHSAIKRFGEVSELYERRLVESTAQDAPKRIPDGFELSTRSAARIQGFGATRLFERVTTQPLRAEPVDETTARRGEKLEDGDSITREYLFVDDNVEAEQPVGARAELDPTLVELATWSKSSSKSVDVKPLLELSKRYSFAPARMTMQNFSTAMKEQLRHSKHVVMAYKKQAKVDPIGFLHLERLSFVPAGIERGELVYSLPLAPGEEVKVSHKEWRTTSEEFEKIITDSLEEYSEEGVTESSELSQSTSSQQQHSNGLSASVSTTGGYGPVSVTAGLNANIQSSSSNSQEFSRNHSIAVTRKASSRAKKEHKISFKVNSTEGEEETTVRRIKNPFEDKSARVDYYQLIRKWEVKLWRYGIRLTYDILIPEPGSDVLSKIKQVNDLTAALEEGFGSPSSSYSWARFDLEPTEISRSNYTTLAAKFNATVPAPPADYKSYNVSRTHDWKSKEEAEGREYHVLEVETDPGYYINYVMVDQSSSHYIDEPYEFYLQSVDDFFGVSGKRQLIYRTKYLGAAYVELRVGAKLGDDAYREWQLKAWSAMRDAAQSEYFEKRVTLKNKLSDLKEALGATDALSLRKFERDEIMKGVLRWLFGPDFEFVPEGIPSDLYDSSQAVKTHHIWKEVNQHGELIKFLHHAIEWENLLYFLYPYFWSHISRWEMKKFLQHPDFMHQTFLKSGSARVVLTIRPGFEESFLSFVETGSLDGLPHDHPYLTIVEEMKAFAKTNYPGIPSANPEDADENEQGVEIGSWFEFTPTSALDIAFGDTLPSA